MGFFVSQLVRKASDIYFYANKSKITAQKFNQPAGFTVTYHAGAMLTKPNSIYSVRAAVKNNADIVEFDVSFRPDGTPVIIHNSSPTEEQGELLKDALEVVAQHPSCRINLDLKSLINIGEVEALVKKYGLFDRVFYTGVFEDWVETVRTNSDIV